MTILAGNIYLQVVKTLCLIYPELTKGNRTNGL